jgi:hypothetical protein
MMLLGAAPLFPVVAAAAHPRRVRGVRAWIFAWAVVQAAGQVAQFWLNMRDVHNLWVGYVVEPVSAAVLLWGLSLWQGDAVGRLTLRLAIPVAISAFAVLTFAFDSATTFSRAAQPMLFLVCLGAAAFTLVERSRVAAGDLAHQDWLWIGAGLVLNYATGSTLLPVARLLVGGNFDLFLKAYEFALAVVAVGFLAVARGIACPTAT